MRFEPIELQSIIAYRDIFRLPMDDFDADILCQLDDLWQAAQPEIRTK